MEYIVSIPDGMVDRLHKIRSRFDEIAKDREALKLRKIDGVRLLNYSTLRHATGHMVDEKNIFGRDADVTKVINLLLSKNDKSLSVISIIGKGGLGKTTIAQLVYNDTRVRQCFDLFGWVCVSEYFDVGRMIEATLESFTRKKHDFSWFSPLQEELVELVKDRKILLVLDDVWNENQDLWELYRAPLSKAKWICILVTTRNENVAEVMLTTERFKPGYLPEDSCWQLFQHFAFNSTNYSVPAHFVEMGWKIMSKCGGMPLAVKSIACLLRHKTDESSWKEILESNLWESKASSDIFPALHFSYAYLPAHLKPCFLLCSMYPKNYLLERNDLINLWISHGYIENDGRSIMELGVQYYDQLIERSFLDDVPDQYYGKSYKLHDIIHDLARLNSEHELYSVNINQPLDSYEANILQNAYHLYVFGFMEYINQIPEHNLKGLRTFSMDLRDCRGDTEHQYCIKSAEAMNLKLKQSPFNCQGSMLNLTQFEALRAMELKGEYLVAIHDSIATLKHLSHLHLYSDELAMLPESIGLLYNLQTFILECINSPLEYIPEGIGYLANLRYIFIQCDNLKKLPKSLGSLTNLQGLVLECEDLENIPSDITALHNLQELALDAWLDAAFLESLGCLKSLEELSINTPSELPSALGNCSNLKLLQIKGCSVMYNPHGLKNFPAVRRMAACLRVTSIGWLKDMKDLEGELIIEGLKNISNLVDAQHANLRNKCKIETLILQWNIHHLHEPSGRCYEVELRLVIIKERSEGTLVGKDMSFSLLECLQPHPHLKTLVLEGYPSATTPGWMGDPLSLQAIQEIRVGECTGLQSLPFSNLHTLKLLKVSWCSIFNLQLEQLPSQLETLSVYECEQLEQITGLWNLQMLAKLEVTGCKALKSITMDMPQLVESTEALRWRSTASLKELDIENCPLLHALPHELTNPTGSCNVAIHGCSCPDIFFFFGN